MCVKKSFLPILFSLFFFFPFIVRGGTDKFFGSNNYLSNSHVNAIYQDRAGYIWVCTENGLNVFNGVSFKTYYHINNDTTSLINNSVLAVFEDTSGRFWVGTTGGVQTFNKGSERFQTIKFSYPNISDFSYNKCIIEDSKGNIWMSTSRAGAICIKKNSTQPIYYIQTNSNICSNKINIIYEDRFGNIWIGSQDNGISVLNLDNHTIVNYSHKADDSNSLSSNRIYSIVESEDGKILVGTIDGGIDAFDFNTHKFQRNYIPAGEIVFTMKNDSKNNLWIGTDGLGLKKYNPETKSIMTYESDVPNLDLRKAKVHSVIEDMLGNIWVSLYQKGILMIPQTEKVFNNIGYNAFNPQKNIGIECVLSIMEDRSGDVWVGTDGDGIYRLDSQRNVKQHYDTGKLPSNVILSLFQDSKGRIWAGSYLHGMFLYNSGSDRFEKRELFHNGVSINHINVITEDADGNLWVGTNEKGVCLYNPDAKSTSFLQYDLLKTKNQLLSNSVHTINFTKNHTVWIGTSAGLSLYDIRKKTFEDYTYENGKLSNNNILTAAIDKDGSLWAGSNYGLNHINPSTGDVVKYTENEGLSNVAISGIEIDRYGNLWISTYFGLSHYDRSLKKFSNYYSYSGLINNEFRRGAHCQSQNGELFFGSSSGLSYFQPFRELSEHALSNLVFTDLYIFNKIASVSENDDTVLKESLDASEQINLSYNLTNFSIGFTALEFNSPDRVVYEVMLEGFDDDWVTLPPRTNLATYTNISPGDYVFKVRAFLPGTDAIERSIKVVISPPWWMSWWAKVFYLLAFIGISFMIYRNVIARLEKKKEDTRKKNERDIMQSKLQFFTDISHEIRTPLTLILTPLEQLMKNTPDGETADTYRMISQNGHRILRLVNQVMDMRKADRGHMKLQAQETNVAEFLNRTTTAFHGVAQEKQIDFKIKIEDDIPSVWIDQEKLDKVVFNVLSNAFKYTPEGGRISVLAESTHDDLYIRVSDTGIGIPEELKENIFDRFFQVSNKVNYNQTGTGIGLHLSRRLMEIHHGEIYVEETTEEGTTFTITIPLDGSYLELSEKAEQHIPIEVTREQEVLAAVASVGNSDVDMEALNRKKKKHKLLIVEDDQGIRDYIAKVLSDDYHILIAKNGILGLETAIQEQPDCIITDVMMPEMDGIEMTEKIKKNDKTNHIPVIVLSAKTDIQHRLEGLNVGADSYIPKPFNIDHLKVRISKLIELRQTMRDKYEGRNELDQDTINLKTEDEKFLERLESIVKNKISEPELSVESLSKDIGLSRSQLQRKLKQLTDQNPRDYIKTTRLRHAAWLLASKKVTISEITYATGFSSLSHFSNSFREFYGMSPSRYMEIHNQKERNDE